MYLIDKTYFVKELTIPNLNEMNSPVLTDINRYIDTDVRLVLTNALGYQLFSEFDAQMVQGPTGGTLSITADTRWQNLVYGVQYTGDTGTVKWKGLLYTEGILPQSPLTSYVYVDWLSNNQTLLTGTGEKVVVAQNAINTSSTQRQTVIWNKFVEQYQGLCSNRHDYYNGRYNYDYYINSYGIRVKDYRFSKTFNGNVSLLQFLVDHPTDYPDANLFQYQIKNQLGL